MGKRSLIFLPPACERPDSGGVYRPRAGEEEACDGGC
jgi:hypothetical protein